jgi:hypothetical protein
MEPTCCDNWDQRIMNEPIYERNFLYAQPPILIQDRPRSTVWCATRPRQPWLHAPQPVEQAAADYWAALNRCGGGTMTPAGVSRQDLSRLQSKYPDRPWLAGVQRHIDGESTLFRLNYYNPRDCVADDVQKELDVFNARADAAFTERMRADTSMHLQSWNNSTSPKQMFK